MLLHPRNIYYNDPALFKSQNVVDRYVDILAYTFDVPRASLNVVSCHCPPYWISRLRSRFTHRPLLQKALLLATFIWFTQMAPLLIRAMIW